jgi:CheY-like chemotaxis protein
MRILLVEDHDDTRHVLKRSLTRSGHEVAAAEDLQSGIDLLGSGDFDVIVSDIALPDGTGYALISEARKRGSAAVGIAFSAYDYPPDVLEPKATGFDHHLNKPSDSDRLFSLVDEAAAELSILH